MQSREYWLDHRHSVCAKANQQLFSVHAAALKRNMISFGHKYRWIRKKGKIVRTGSPSGKLYKLNCEVTKPMSEKTKVAGDTSEISKSDLWHQRLAHINTKQMRQLMEQSKELDLPLNKKYSFCKACVKGKMHRLPHPPLKEIKSKQKLELVYNDVCSPMQTQSHGGSCYFITFTDDYSHYCKTYFLKKKSEAFTKFKEFKKAAENESNLKSKAL